MKDIEFFTSKDGVDLIIQENGTFSPLTEKHHDIINMLFDRIRDDYPEAFAALQKIYGQSVKHKYLAVRRFGKCNFGNYDNRPDIRKDDIFQLEFVACPMRGECLYEGLICRPKLSTNLTEREGEVLQLICAGMEDIDIANRLFISYFTVCNHRRNIHRKLGTSNKLEILNYARANGLIEQR